MTKELEHRAAVLAELGYYVFPVAKKIPMVKWGEESTREPDFDWRGATHVGIDCGKSGIAALDIDDIAQVPVVRELRGGQLFRDWCQRTQSGGYHYLYRNTSGVRNSAGALLPGVDVRGEGGYIVAYAPLNEWTDTQQLQGWPDAFTPNRGVIHKGQSPQSPLEVVSEGGRNHDLIRHLGGYMHRCPGAEFADVLAVARDHTRTMHSPPLPDIEVVQTANSAMRWSGEADAIKEANRPPMFSFIGPLLKLESGPPPRALCGNWLREGTLNVISSRAGAGKTALMAAMVAAMKRGEPFLGMPTQDPGRVLWINGDMPAWQVKERLSCLAEFADVDIAMAEMADLFRHETDLLEVCGGYQFVIFDNRGTLLTVRETQKEESWIPYQRLMHRVTTNGATVVMQCHNNKAENASVSGSEAQERTTTAMLSIHKEKGSDVRVLRFDKNRMGTEPDLKFLIKAGELGELHCLLADDTGAPTEQLPQVDLWRVAVVGILSARKAKGEVEPITKVVMAEQLAKQFGVEVRTASNKVQEICGKLVDEGKAVRHQVGKEASWIWK
jgi:hypothetical protein